MTTIIFGLDAIEAVAIAVRHSPTPQQRSPATKEPAGSSPTAPWGTQGKGQHLPLASVSGDGEKPGPFLPDQPLWR